jgi:3alpha(or 20beta)-hydroxysteroid dehydrogenase
VSGRRATDTDVTAHPLLAGKSVVVTGAARGLGKAIAAACVGYGAGVVVTDVLEDELQATAGALGDAATPYCLDVTDEEAWDRMAEWCRARVGRPDVLVNNAGVAAPGLLGDASYGDLRRMFEVNVGGTLLGLKWYLDLHIATACDRPGSIVNISSVRGLIGAGRTSTYSASKFAVRGLTKSAAVELGPLGIRVNAVCPGPIETDARADGPKLPGFDFGGYVTRLPLRRMGQAADVAEAVAWLASDASAYVTGVDLPIDGGLTATSHSATDPPVASAARSGGS